MLGKTRASEYFNPFRKTGLLDYIEQPLLYTSAPKKKVTGNLLTINVQHCIFNLIRKFYLQIFCS